MKQYLDLLKRIKEEGTLKPEARKNMPNTISLFGEQIKFNLSEGFPIITTKKVSFKNIINELIWFLRGDTNIKFLVDNNCNIWNEDSYNYYLKLFKYHVAVPEFAGSIELLEFEKFIEIIKKTDYDKLPKRHFVHSTYTLGDCGEQYGKLWRNYNRSLIDQFSKLIDGLNKNPMSRRHIITAWNPETLDDMALNACHALVQFNCRPILWEEKLDLAKRNPNIEMENFYITEAAAGNRRFGIVPQYYLDCQMYQRSADVFLGVPYNITSYSLLTHIIASMVDMIPGNYIHTFGDVHIYENHLEQIDEQLSRPPLKLPTLLYSKDYSDNLEKYKSELIKNQASYRKKQDNLNSFIYTLSEQDFHLDSYNYHPAIKGKLSTGL